MDPQLVELYNLQLADRHLDEAQRSLEALDRGASLQAQLAALRADAASLASEKRELEKSQRECEIELSSTEQLLKRTEKRIAEGQIHNAHEMESAERELETFRRRKSDTEDRLLTLLEEQEGYSSRAFKLVQTDQQLRKQLEAVRAAAEAAKERLERDIAAVSKRRSELQAVLPAPLLKTYERMRGFHRGIAVVRVVNERCDACGVAVSEILKKEVLESTELVPCQGCGRYLYTNSEHAPIS